MAAITTSNLTLLADNIAKALVDIQTTFVTNATTVAPTVTTITNGLTGSSTSTYTHLAALADITQEVTLNAPAQTSLSALLAAITQSSSLSTYYNALTTYMNALDSEVGGLNAFLTTNTLMVHPLFAAAFNYYTTYATALGLRGSANAPTAIAAANIFPSTVVDPLATIAVTGAAAGTFTAGSSINTASYGAVPLYLYNSSTGASAAATSFTITYTNASGVATPVTHAISASMATGIGSAISLAVSGTAVTNIVVNSSGTSGESYHVYAPILRAVAY